MATIKNSFTAGMDRDSSKNKYDNTHYFDANNIRIITQDGLSSGAIENVKGNRVRITTDDGNQSQLPVISEVFKSYNNDIPPCLKVIELKGNEIFDLGEAVSFAKFRLAYAETGSDTDPYQVTPTYSPDSFGGKPTVGMKDGLPNVNLKSQRSKEFEIGTNLAFFDNKITVDFTYYNKHSFDQILSAPLPWSSGANSIKFKICCTRSHYSLKVCIVTRVIEAGYLAC